MHVTAQRGYTELAEELLNHWTQNSVDSPHQNYSISTIQLLLLAVQRLRQSKAVNAEPEGELRLLAPKLGVTFAHLSDELDKRYSEEIGLVDLLKICGHPLVLSKDASGNTPLHYAAEGGYLGLCKLLIEYGAKVNEQNNAGETP